MTIEKVKHFFAAEGKAVIELSQSSATVELAARALNTEPARIAKTLSFAVNGSIVLVVAAGDMKIDNHKFKDYFHCKAKMLSAEEVLSATGHAVGGVCPFAVNEGVEVYLDESLKAYKTVYPAAGSGNSMIQLTIPELERYGQCKKWIDVCK